MASNYTSNFNLCQWAASDKVLRTEFNADNAKIDAALATLNNGKASVSELERVSGQADALAETSAEHTRALERKGNCRIAASTYVGTGGVTRLLNFPSKPVFAVILGETQTFMGYGCETALCFTTGGSAYRVNLNWSGNAVTLSSGTSQTSDNARVVSNTEDQVYKLISFYNAEN